MITPAKLGLDERDVEIILAVNNRETYASIGESLGITSAAVSNRVKNIRKRHPGLLIPWEKQAVTIDSGVRNPDSNNLSPRDAAKVRLAAMLEWQHKNLMVDPGDVNGHLKMADLLLKMVTLIQKLYPDDIAKELIQTSDAAGGSTLRQKLQEQARATREKASKTEVDTAA